MNDLPVIGGTDYLVWRKAYLAPADVRPAEVKIDLAPPTPDGAVDREEWAYFFNVRDLLSEEELFTKTISHLAVTGQNISHNLKSAEAFYQDYADYADYIRNYFTHHPGLPGGVKLGNNPEQLLQLAAKHPDSLALISFVGEAATFANVTPAFREQALDFLWGQYRHDEQSMKTCRQNDNCEKSDMLEIKAKSLVNALTSLSQPGLLSNVQSQKLLTACLELLKAGETTADYFPQLIFNLLEQGTVSQQQRKAAIDKLAKTDYDLRSVYQLTQSPNLNQAELLDICRHIAGVVMSRPEKERNLVSGLILALPYAYLNGNLDKQGAGEVVNILLDLTKALTDTPKSERYCQKMLSLALAMMMTDQAKPLSSRQERQRVIGLYTGTLLSRPETADPEAFRDLFYNLAEFLPADESAGYFADYLNNTLPLALANKALKPHTITKFLQTAAITINSIHDRDLEQNDNHNKLLNWQLKHRRIDRPEYQRQKELLKESRDARRRSLTARLSPQAKILLIGLAGADLYTSSFMALYGSLNLTGQNIDQFIKELEAADLRLPAGKVTTNFLLTLSSFGKLTDLLLLRPDYFLAYTRRLLSVKDPKELVTNTFLISKTISDFFNNPRLAAYKETIEKFLLELFQTDRTGAIGYLIKNNQASFSPAQQTAVTALCRRLPELLPPLVPANWIKNGSLQGKLFFRQKEHYYLLQSMLKNFGFSRRAIDKDTVELSLTVNGVRLVVEATTKCDKVSIDRDIKSGRYFLIGHRGHSTELASTFNPGDNFQDLGLLIFIGSCGGFRAIPELMNAYSGNYFIADETTGEGAVNNKLLYHFMSLIAQNRSIVARGKYQFAKLQEEIVARMPGYEKLGLVMPHDKSLLLYDFVSKYKKQTEGQASR